jgi:hypothetical protein
LNGVDSFLGDVFSYGLVWCYLLGLIPAMLITAAKDLWTMFFAGLLSFGLAWFFGVLSWAKPDSLWANRFYPEGLEPGSSELRERLKPRRQRLFAIALLTFVLIGAFSARPTVLIGTDPESLQHSVGGGLVLFEDQCRSGPGENWTCYIFDSGSSGDVPYLTEVDWAGCWTARSLHTGRLAPQVVEDSGCVTMFDHVRPLSRLLD